MPTLWSHIICLLHAIRCDIAVVSLSLISVLSPFPARQSIAYTVSYLRWRIVGLRIFDFLDLPHLGLFWYYSYGPGLRFVYILGMTPLTLWVWTNWSKLTIPMWCTSVQEFLKSHILASLWYISHTVEPILALPSSSPACPFSLFTFLPLPFRPFSPYSFSHALTSLLWASLPSSALPWFIPSMPQPEPCHTITVPCSPALPKLLPLSRLPQIKSLRCLACPSPMHVSPLATWSRPALCRPSPYRHSPFRHVLVSYAVRHATKVIQH